MTSISTQVLIVGAGVTGLGVAWDACLRGLKVVVIEQGDIGEGTTGRFHGLLHSGGRYVVEDPRSATDCATENVILRKIAPPVIEDTGGMFVATPADPPEYPDLWKTSSEKLGLPFDEIGTSQALSIEPNLNPRSSRIFRVRDAAIDSFELTHMLVNAIREYGGRVLLRHRLVSFKLHNSSVNSAEVEDLKTGEQLSVGAEFVINASGPWVNKVTGLAGIHIPLALEKGSMVAMSQRLTHTVLNRCRPVGDGDIIVPVGTVCVVGTTDTSVKGPEDLTIEASEIDLLLAEGDVLLPGLVRSRALRSWTGIRALFQSGVNNTLTRKLPRSHNIIDHERTDGIAGMISIVGGKLTTFRLMAEETVDLLCSRMAIEAKTSTNTTPIIHSKKRYYRLPYRAYGADRAHTDEPIICECESVPYSDLAGSLSSTKNVRLDDLRRDFRLGMGPCQAAFCAVRAANIASLLSSETTSKTDLPTFILERWKGNRPLAWGSMLRQIELQRRVYIDLLGHKSNKG